MIENAAICTVAPKSRLGYVRTLYKSIREQHPEVDFYLLLLDQAGASFYIKRESFRIIQLFELDNISCPPSLFFEHNLKELKHVFKPYFFENLFKNFQIQKLIYFDPEVLVLNDLWRVWDLLEKKSLILLPSSTKASEREVHPSEMDILNAGAFRQGFIGMSNTATALSFLRDRQERLFNFCSSDPERVVDTRPRKLGSFSWMLEETYLLCDPAYCDTYWALHQLAPSLVMKEGRIMVNDQPLVFLNFRGFDLKNLKVDIKDQVDDQLLRPLFEHYRHLLRVNGQYKTEKWTNVYDFFDNGVRIPDIARKLYRECKEKDTFFVNPFLTEGDRVFLKWLNEPVDESSKSIFSGFITRLMWEIYESRPDLRGDFPNPLGEDKGTFLAWFRTHGLREYNIDRSFLPKHQTRNSVEKLISLVYLTKGLFLCFATYSIPRFLKQARMWAKARIHIFFRKKVTFVRRHAFRRLGVLKVKGARVHFGVNVAGPFRGEFGIGEAARSSLHALQSVGVPCVVNNIDFHSHRNKDLSFTKFSRTNPYGLNLVHVNAPETKEIIRQKGMQYLEDKYNIGFWFWELSCFPEEWIPFFTYYNEIWVASEFCFESIAKVSPIPIILISLPVFLEKSVEKNRGKFYLPEDHFIFLFIFDFRSRFERKNPIAIVEAFSRAFGRRDKTLLVIKTINAGYFPREMDHLQKAVEGKKVHLIDGHLDSWDLVNLMASCDSYVSLHRSEGFGIGMARAMFLGKPVIATGYSGNLDFMNSSNSFLVNYELIELTQDFGPYKRGNVWADPDIDHAAELMHLVCNDHSLSKSKSRQAEQDLRKLMDPKIIGAQMMERLRRISGN